MEKKFMRERVAAQNDCIDLEKWNFAFP